MIDRGSTRNEPLVVVLGAGVNGAAVARELAVNGVGVVVIDAHDVAFGATSKSSRLIHGGLRYLEYGETDLVKESLEERGRLLRLAPQFVHPLRLFLPIERRTGGFWTAAARFVGLHPRRGGRRGLWVARAGLTMYDLFARDPLLPKHSVHRRGGDNGAPPTAPRYRFHCSYFDGQMLYPERFTLALLEDARRAAEGKSRFEVHTHAAVRLDGARLFVTTPGGVARSLEPALAINASGAWGDWTLRGLEIPSQRLFGGTKGSHILSFAGRLRDALAGSAIYAEADDGRLVFILPFGDGVYIGTTDEPFEEPPDQAVATEAEIQYLLEMVNEVFPDVSLQRSEVAMHCCGVRPLPYVSADTPSAITRRHWIAANQSGPFPIYTLIGGKLTTCRSLGEQTADQVLVRLGLPRIADTRERIVPGGEDYPADASRVAAMKERVARETGATAEQVRALWPLLGTRTREVFGESESAPLASLPGTDIPEAFARWSIRREWARTIEDLVERRLLLPYSRGVSLALLTRLGEILAEEGVLPATDVARAAEQAKESLRVHFGILLDSNVAAPSSA